MRTSYEFGLGAAARRHSRGIEDVIWKDTGFLEPYKFTMPDIREATEDEKREALAHRLKDALAVLSGDAEARYDDEDYDY